MPAGARLKFRSNVPQYAKFVFEPCDPKFHDICMANKEKGLANVIVAGESYGQGSSREHAALCPMYLGVKAVVAKSIERIHRANLINFGIVPFTFVNAKDYDLVKAGDVLTMTASARPLRQMAPRRSRLAASQSPSRRLSLTARSISSSAADCWPVCDRP